MDEISGGSVVRKGRAAGAETGILVYERMQEMDAGSGFVLVVRWITRLVGKA
jgi:hypothetical protein